MQNCFWVILFSCRCFWKPPLSPENCVCCRQESHDADLNRISTECLTHKTIKRHDEKHTIGMSEMDVKQKPSDRILPAAENQNTNLHYLCWTSLGDGQSSNTTAPKDDIGQVAVVQQEKLRKVNVGCSWSRSRAHAITLGMHSWQLWERLWYSWMTKFEIGT